MQVGWGHDDLIARLEAKRKTRCAAYYKKSMAALKLKQKAVEQAVKALPVEEKNLLASVGLLTTC